MMILAHGKISTFGGPLDDGVGPNEGLSLIDYADLREWWFSRLFYNFQPPGTTGLARKLNPAAFYIAMRWSEHGLTREIARRCIFKLSNPANGKVLYAQGADTGPAHWTERVVDMSPGAANVLGLHTDDEAVVGRLLLTIPGPRALEIETL